MCIFWLIIILVISHFGFESGTLVLIASVPGRCLSFTIFSLFGKRGKKNIEKPTEHVVHIPVLLASTAYMYDIYPCIRCRVIP